MANNDLVKSLLKGLDILEIVSASEDGISLAEITERTGLKGPTAYNLIRTLVACEYLERAENPVRYKPGLKAVRIGAGYMRRNFLQHAERVIHDLECQLPSPTITLAEMVSGQIVTTLRISPDNPGRIESCPNRVFAPYSSASALVFQAFLSQEQLTELRNRHSFWEYGSHFWENSLSLDGFIDRVRKNGYALLDIKEKHPSFVAAAPVFSINKKICAALGVCLKNTNTVKDKDDYIEKLLKAARRLSQKEEEIC